MRSSSSGTLQPKNQLPFVTSTREVAMYLANCCWRVEWLAFPDLLGGATRMAVGDVHWAHTLGRGGGGRQGGGGGGEIDWLGERQIVFSRGMPKMQGGKNGRKNNKFVETFLR